MFNRILVSAWASLGLTPLLIWCFPAERLRTAMIALLGLLWIASLLALVIATRRDPTGAVLGVFARSFPARFGLVVVIAATQVVAIVAPRREEAATAIALAFGPLMLFALIFFTLWAVSRSGQTLTRRVGQVLLLLSTFVACVVLLEISLRVIAPRPQHDHQATWGHPIVNNSLGFREKEFQAPKPLNTYRIMVLGDSITWGAGLAENERYTNLLQRKLQESFPEERIEVLNFGFCGGPTVKERDMFRQYVGLVQPDLVVLGFCMNDPQPKTQIYAVEMDRYSLVYHSCKCLRRLGLNRSAEFLGTRFDQTLRNLGLVPQWPEALDRAYDTQSAEWKDFETALQDIKNLSDAHSLPPPIFVPLLHGNGDFNNPDSLLSKYIKWWSQAEATAQRIGFSTINLEEEFKKQGWKNREVNKWDNHPSPECNKVYAEKIAEFVAALLGSGERGRESLSRRM